MPGDSDPEYVAARRVLLDALTALVAHAQAIVVAGAQAIYLRTGSADLTVAPYTTDGDLALDPSRLGPDPALESAMQQAGFHLMPLEGRGVEPGIWLKSVDVGGRKGLVPVDLIVPAAAVEGGGRRGVRLGPPHGSRAACRARGLEAVLVDHSRMTISALDPGDHRSVEAFVAGPAALLVAKLHKLHDRAEGRHDRLDDKDASDVFRLMQMTRAEDMGRIVSDLSRHPMAGSASLAAVEYMDNMFGRAGRTGVRMAMEALRLAVPAERVERICVAYARDFGFGYVIGRQEGD